jgi:hypothetical protein
MHFRDELYGRLRVSDQSLLAGLEDVAQRLSSGVSGLEMERLIKALAADARYWMNSDPPLKQLQVMAQAVEKVAGAQGPKYYDTVKWRAKENRLVWELQSATLSEDDALRAVAKELQDQLAHRTSTRKSP